ncbi:hypothetical protein CYMTET_44596 [Cymbomonas tetramitiformis]|uniref:Uncharacterized protein n=1 Tax=Cymbomonas tetramitiformis TaxID=36881 RepID=A0AAE0C1L1_9CHLO|nr:hypothetical protein CYMTET_44596 [Cymbomonas tetramitiformis]
MDSYMMAGMSQERRTKLVCMYKRMRRQPECHATSDKELELLCRCVVLRGVGFDACAGTGNISRWTAQTLTNDVSDLNPDAYDFMIFSPPFLLSDLFLTWALKQPVKMWCIHLAGDYYTNAPDYRLQALKPLIDSGLVLFVSGLPIVENRPMRRCVWMILFRDKKIMRKSCVEEACANIRTSRLNEVDCM